jgi:hypothetical protein
VTEPDGDLAGDVVRLQVQLERDEVVELDRARAGDGDCLRIVAVVERSVPARKVIGLLDRGVQLMRCAVLPVPVA